MGELLKTDPQGGDSQKCALFGAGQEGGGDSCSGLSSCLFYFAEMSDGGLSIVSIPSGVKKVIQDIKEISRSHSDEEIYAMLRECSMDPNETVQRLLSQDPFHEVKRKRDKKKENLNSREQVDSRWKPPMHRRDPRTGRGTYSSRYISHDAGVGRSNVAGKDNVITPVSGKDIRSASSSSGSQEMEDNLGVSQSSSLFGFTNGSTTSALVDSSQEFGFQMSEGHGLHFSDENSIGRTVPGGTHAESVQTTNGFPSSRTLSGVDASASDPVLVHSIDRRVSGMVGAIQHTVGINVATSDTYAGYDMPSNERATERTTFVRQGNLPTNSQVLDAPQPLSNSQFGSSSSWASSNYGSRPQVIAPQKAAPSKEWKPKSAIQVPGQVAVITGVAADAPGSFETNSWSEPGVPEEAASKIELKLEDLHLSDGEHVIIPNHLQVPEAERSGLSFGSFDASFSLGTSFANGPDNGKYSILLTNASPIHEENIKASPLSTQNTYTTAQEEEDLPEHAQSASQMPENYSGETDASSSISPEPEYDQNNQAEVEQSQGAQFSIIHNPPIYSAFGLIPPTVGNQFAPFESSGVQAHDSSSLTSFIVQQQFDPSAGYYTQLYQPASDANGHLPQYLALGAAPKYNENANPLPHGTQPAQEPNANPPGDDPAACSCLPTTSQPPFISLSPKLFPIPLLFSILYLPPIQHYLSSPTFLPQPLAGSLHPPAVAAAATTAAMSDKRNTGNATHSGMPNGYGSYPPAGYIPSPAAATGNSTNEDLPGPHYGDGNLYIPGQQNDTSAVCFPVMGQDVPSSLYGFPQAGHGAFAGVIHPAHSVATTAAATHPLPPPLLQSMAGAADIMGLSNGIYPSPQATQLNWANNY
ncbi:unnamed protein product [Spirodela intermedia]|uniref:GBF-interacting protein 1 N-terminal domain-containing protein n=1 Tax=Spirodela intermedia TaxID=51605 RepID=A0A7I8JRQ4_SPIIN|nr:unnamed protein product [Spirodela intermedia]CAA6672435.1 unnamed protein product [Spirodela intermedia]